MRVPKDMMANTATVLALFAIILSLFGIAASLALYASSYMALGSVDAALSPQFNSAKAALLSASEAISYAANSSEYGYDALNSVSGAFLSYSDSTKALSSSLDGIASIPPFSLDPNLAAAASSMQTASSQFSNASQSAVKMAGLARSASSSMQGTATDVSNAASQLEGAKRNFKSTLSAIGMLSFFFCLCLLALFSSVILVSLSLLLSHYPDLLDKEKIAEAPAAPPQGKQMQR
jgi:hypothetical protein